MLTEPIRGRDRLLAAALRLFAAKGYAATSVADIQRASGLAPGSGALYKHFGSKRELLEAAVAHRIDNIQGAREQHEGGQCRSSGPNGRQADLEQPAPKRGFAQSDVARARRGRRPREENVAGHHR